MDYRLQYYIYVKCPEVDNCTVVIRQNVPGPRKDMVKNLKK